MSTARTHTEVGECGATAPPHSTGVLWLGGPATSYITDPIMPLPSCDSRGNAQINTLVDVCLTPLEGAYVILELLSG